MSEERDTTLDGQREAAPEETPAPVDAAVEEVDDTEERAQDAAVEAPEEPDFKDLYLRAAAETENVRKRARRDVEAAQARAVARLVREILPSLDNLDRALAAAEAEEADAEHAAKAVDGETADEHHLTKGIRLVQQELLAALTRVGVEAYSPQGEAFDPHHHEAVAQQPVEGAASGTVVQVYQPGYRYKDEVLRAAKVVVAA
ncbi:MAG TPA: nucleotide exchange factor GrpE [Baekduia sp.]|uniref:nucleotide exchange factor GrpE n=1 Tax=Baekduia sp. TaxID=2600305 RepID=UPI002C763B31|nr:nucleotide exchange factor GrpE [Baekduia sp.]HMJ35763.1 nucleotide exchange factor GrpE [Baekduia sp.]